ncbi:cytochrome c maturation protein CcmE [Xanthovirga aplysinae]|uniref:cytochrome c maturation protein CcmE domain-containing protein n=1 Tax=Xanthovirga aplysinae TaxID=2529853 RepID=UPI0012BB9CE8|nr:cytochrome c maturation protein CcmE [Xanthovirga aplysinae]MTI33633.1 cytochrome c maturation protein CcmE [Xanthovirga aplysinae]
MKKSHILGIVVIAIAITVIVSTAGDASSYVTFKEAHEMAEKGKDAKIHVVGQLKKDEQGQVIGIYPSEDKLSFSFMLIDNNGQEQMVSYHEPMPNDFMRSEQVVVIGGYNQNHEFLADKILMKCPSKYQETEVK